MTVDSVEAIASLDAAHAAADEVEDHVVRSRDVVPGSLRAVAKAARTKHGKDVWQPADALDSGIRAKLAIARHMQVSL